MKITFIAFTDKRGGAAKAAIRIRNLFNETSFISIEDKENKIQAYHKVKHLFYWIISFMLTKLQRDRHNHKFSLNIFGSKYIKNKVIEASLLHVHWINNETLAIKDFKHLSNKSVITLHDEWFYCGAEHHALSGSSYCRVVDGYTTKNKNVNGIDLNRIIWKYKVKNYVDLKGVIFTVPSTWMKSRAENSYLLKNMDVRVIPNPINIDVFKRNESSIEIEGVDSDDFIILFGAVDGGVSKIKGFDLLVDAISIFSKSLNSTNKIKIITFGGREQKSGIMSGIKTIELGHISSETELADIYSLSSVTIVPSRAESFGQVAAESLSCETPVIAFNHSGLTDIVKHKENGYLAEPFKSSSLATGISWFYHLSEEDRSKVGISGRMHVLEFFCDKVIRNKLLSIYKELKNR